MNIIPFFLLPLYFKLIFSLNNDHFNNKIVDNNKNSDNEDVYQNCEIIEQCHPCSFDELKTVEDCQINGYKQRIRCVNKSENIYYSETCSKNMRITPVLYFFVINVIVFLVSFRVLKNFKVNFNQIMIKLSSLKD